jgi:hypothetical protein
LGELARFLFQIARNACFAVSRCSAANLLTSSVIFIEQKCGPHIEHQPRFKLRLNKSAFAEVSIFARASAFNFYRATRRRCDKPAGQVLLREGYGAMKKCAIKTLHTVLIRRAGIL